MQLHLQNPQIKVVCQGHRVKVKVDAIILACYLQRSLILTSSKTYGGGPRVADPAGADLVEEQKHVSVDPVRGWSAFD